MDKTDKWVDERMRLEQLVIQAGRIKTDQARAAAIQAISDFKKMYPEHADSVAAFAHSLESQPVKK